MHKRVRRGVIRSVREWFVRRVTRRDGLGKIEYLLVLAAKDAMS